MNISPKKILVIGGCVAAAFMVAAIAGGSFYTIDQGERGIVLRNGKIHSIAEPGLGFKMPLIDDVKRMSVQSQARVFDKVPVYSGDQQTAVVQFSVNFRIPPDQVGSVYSDYGSIDGLVQRLIDRQSPEEVRNVFGRFTAEVSIKERERLSAEVQMAVKKSIVGPMQVESVQLESIDFSKVYEDSIEQRMLAEVEVQKVTQNAAREKVQASIKVIQAQATADSQVAQAKAEAEAITLKGNAEAKAIDARGRALRDNPSLIELVKAENWNGALPTTMVPGAAVPFMNVGK